MGLLKGSPVNIVPQRILQTFIILQGIVDLRIQFKAAFFPFLRRFSSIYAVRTCKRLLIVGKCLQTFFLQLLYLIIIVGNLLQIIRLR